jgi:hypothetical protein
MIQLNDNTTKLEDLLARMAESVQLDDTRRGKMESAYETVKELLEADEEFFKYASFEIYLQGSVLIGTTVRPVAKNEFDLDIVVHILVDWTKYKPEQIYSHLKRVLLASPKHKHMVEPKNRCIRLNYAGDFHMDILPGCPENSYDANMLKVPDRELGDWSSSNPRGYGAWFTQKANSVTQSLLEKAYAMQNLPSDEFAKKKPLQRAVQLIKIYRDKYFENNQDMAASSVILTTIAGQYYQGEDSIYSTIDNVIIRIKSNTAQLTQGGIRLKVLNPVNQEEDFTEKWDDDPKLYEHFLKFIKHLDTEWQKLKNEHGLGDEILKGLFGESVYNRGINEQTEFLKKDPYSGLKKLAQPVTITQKPYLM